MNCFRKSQVTLFIILGIFIIIIVGLFFVLRDSITFRGIPSEFEPVYNNFLDCVEKVGIDGIYFIGLSGGYYEVLGNSFFFQNEQISYYYLDSDDTIPSLEIIQEELGFYVSSELDKCFDISEFSRQGFDINENYGFDVEVKENLVKINLAGSLGIRKGEDSVLIDDVGVEIESDIKNVYDSSIDIVRDYSENPGMICLSCLDETSEEFNVYIESTPFEDVAGFEDDFILYSLLNKNSLMEPKLVWRFVVEK